MAKLPFPRTRHEKGQAWATATLVLLGAFSIYANVRSGQINTESTIVSVVPPIAAFLSTHLISYFSPKSVLGKIGTYGTLGTISIIAMYGSGYHIVETVMRTGQPVQTAISYVFITDAPMLLAAVILANKVSTARTVTSTAKRTSTATPAKKSVPAKTTKPAVTTPRARKTTKPTIVPSFVGPSIVDETADVA